jgi:phosphoribosylformylglycinamidine synthase
MVGPAENEYAAPLEQEGNRMARVKVLVLRTAGINCDQETVFAWQQAGADAELVHVDRLIESPARLRDTQILTLPGGFSYGDDVAAGRILGNQLARHLIDPLRAFLAAGKLMLGICNGFQVLVKAGLLPGRPGETPAVTLTFNDSSRFEARWVHLEVGTDRCAFLPAGTRLRLPVAHAEGKVVVPDEGVLGTLRRDGHVALRYVETDGGAVDYPANPNGSVDDIAGLTDPTGQILGLMPHPERFVDPTHDPLWTCRDGAEPDGRILFQCAVSRFR